MFCGRCGATNADDARFCAKCGAGLQEQAVAGGQAPSGAPPAPTSFPSGVLGQSPAPYAGAAGAYGSPVPPPIGPAETSGKAIASLICGLLFFIFPAAVAAIILGHLSLSEIDRSAGRLAGRGIALTGLVLGYSGIVAIPFILIIAAIAIPNLLRAKMAANEASAVGSLRTINTAAIAYSTQYDNGFPLSLMAMDGAGDGAPSCDNPQLIEPVLAVGLKSGYVISYVAEPAAKPAAHGCTSAGAASFEVHADPITRGTTGQRSFFTDQSDVIRVESDGPATSDSDPLE